VSCDTACICPEIYDPVCVYTAGAVLHFDNACFAECHGFTDYVHCGDTLCDPSTCPDIYDPVCAISPNGFIHQFDNMCLAICAGFYHFVPCDSTCLCTDVWDPVCVEENGITIQFSNACFAECHGYTNFVPCGGCDCPEYYAPVCAIGPDGQTLQFDNICFAECAGYHHVFHCDSNCVCPAVYDPVCVVTGTGAVITFGNSCEAECAGYHVYFPCDDLPGGNGGIRPDFNMHLTTYPNPSDGHFNIISDLPDGEDITFTVTDIHGKTIRIQHSAETTIEIDISEYPSGLYFIRATSRHGAQSGRVIRR